MASAPVFAKKTCPPFLLTFSANSSTSRPSATAESLRALFDSLMACISRCSFSRSAVLFALALVMAAQNLSEDSLSFKARLSFERSACLLLVVRTLTSMPVKDDRVDRVGAVNAVKQPHLDVPGLAGTGDEGDYGLFLRERRPDEISDDGQRLGQFVEDAGRLQE